MVLEGNHCLNSNRLHTSKKKKRKQIFISAHGIKQFKILRMCLYSMLLYNVLNTASGRLEHPVKATCHNSVYKVVTGQRVVFPNGAPLYLMEEK